MDNSYTEKSLSETDLTSLVDAQTTPNNQYVTQRQKGQKRQRESEFGQFKEEIATMMSNMMASQLKEIKKNTKMLDEIKQTNRSIEDAMSFLSTQYEESRAKIAQLESEAVEDRRYIASLENKIMDLLRDSRKGNLEIKNVPTQKNENKEHLINMVAHLGSTIACTINKCDIKDIYRIKNKKENTNTSTIIVETSSVLLKKDVLRKCKDFNIKKGEKLSAKHLGLQVRPDTPIYVTEQLTPQASRLYFLARELKRAKLLEHCWTDYGKIYVRKSDNSPVILVSSEAQIQRLANEYRRGEEASNVPQASGSKQPERTDSV